MPSDRQRQEVTVTEARLRRSREERHSAPRNEGPAGIARSGKEEHAAINEAPRAPLGVHAEPTRPRIPTRDGVRHRRPTKGLIHRSTGPNDQVERRADATPAQKENMNRHVRSNAGLGLRAAPAFTTRPKQARATRLAAMSLCKRTARVAQMWPPDFMMARPILTRRNDMLRGQRGDRTSAATSRTAPLTDAGQQTNARGEVSKSGRGADARPQWPPVPIAEQRKHRRSSAMSPNGQVERRADATPAQKENMNRHVRSNAGLGLRAAPAFTTRPKQARATRLAAMSLCKRTARVAQMWPPDFMMARPILTRRNDMLRGQRGDRTSAATSRTAPLTDAGQQTNARGEVSKSGRDADARPEWAPVPIAA